MKIKCPFCPKRYNVEANVPLKTMVSCQQCGRDFSISAAVAASVKDQASAAALNNLPMAPDAEEPATPRESDQLPNGATNSTAALLSAMATPLNVPAAPNAPASLPNTLAAPPNLPAAPPNVPATPANAALARLAGVPRNLPSAPPNLPSMAQGIPNLPLPEAAPVSGPTWSLLGQMMPGLSAAQQPPAPRSDQLSPSDQLPPANEPPAPEAPPQSTPGDSDLVEALRALQAENQRLRKIVADQRIELEVLKETFERRQPKR